MIYEDKFSMEKLLRQFHKDEKEINIKKVIIAGPCSVESYEQMDKTAEFLKKVGVNILRGGAYKPRTCPTTFQGLEEEGIKILNKIRKKHNIPVITEIMDVETLDFVSENVDILQIGSRNMYNYSLLKAVGKTKKPVLLKRGMSATVNEWLKAAEYIVSGGNDKVILCERGIRTFETYTRNTLDLASVAIIKKESNFPIIVDPSHGTGIPYLIKPMSKAALASGADGIMIEVHHNPSEALSDGKQSLNFEDFQHLLNELSSFVNI